MKIDIQILSLFWLEHQISHKHYYGIALAYGSFYSIDIKCIQINYLWKVIWWRSKFSWTFSIFASLMRVLKIFHQNYNKLQFRMHTEMFFLHNFIAFCRPSNIETTRYYIAYLGKRGKSYSLSMLLDWVYQISLNFCDTIRINIESTIYWLYNFNMIILTYSNET